VASRDHTTTENRGTDRFKVETIGASYAQEFPVFWQRTKSASRKRMISIKDDNWIWLLRVIKFGFNKMYSSKRKHNSILEFLRTVVFSLLAYWCHGGGGGASGPHPAYLPKKNLNLTVNIFKLEKIFEIYR
jgi:hypothetical protein